MQHAENTIIFQYWIIWFYAKITTVDCFEFFKYTNGELKYVLAGQRETWTENMVVFRVWN
jgi:hypothetical protein